MNKRYQAAAMLFVIILAIIGGFLSLLYGTPGSWLKETTTAPVIVPTQPPIGEVFFAPPSPQEAPPKIKDMVMLGYNIMMKTHEYAPDYAGNKLNCHHCHFEGGRMKNTISLVGAPAVLLASPHGKERSLAGWINACVTGSLNGKAIPSDSQEMQSLLEYIYWISFGLPVSAKIPWVGLQPLDVKGDAKAGRDLFMAKCSPCHGAEGYGTDIAPPVWGPDSWSKASPIANQGELGAFIHKFMPFGNPDLTDAQAANVAAFLLEQERPSGNAGGDGE